MQRVLKWVDNHRSPAATRGQRRSNTAVPALFPVVPAVERKPRTPSVRDLFIADHPEIAKKVQQQVARGKLSRSERAEAWNRAVTKAYLHASPAELERLQEKARLAAVEAKKKHGERRTEAFGGLAHAPSLQNRTGFSSAVCGNTTSKNVHVQRPRRKEERISARLLTYLRQGFEIEKFA